MAAWSRETSEILESLMSMSAFQKGANVAELAARSARTRL